VVRMEERFAYWDRELDIAWIPTAPAESVTSEKTWWGIVDSDEKTGKVAGLEILDASQVIPVDLLERMPEPGKPEPDAVAA
jgi:uncharacterized protein YuzE